MYISKRGPLLVLVATLLVMLSPLRCATMPSVREEQRHGCRTATCSYAYLFVRWRRNFNSLVSVYRNGTVDASSQQQNDNSLLRFQTDVSQPKSQEQGKLFINIYNKRAKRYICFNKGSGKVRTLKRLPRSNQGHHLVCRFMEQLMPPTSHSKDPRYMYVAGEQKRRVITFCRGRVATLRRRRPMEQRRRQRQRQQRQRQRAARRRKAGRRGSRRRQRQRHAVTRPHQQRRRTAAAQKSRHNRRRCEYAFMKKDVKDPTAR